MAEDSDFFALRKNMAAAEGDEKMLEEAGNYFKKKCFTTGQVRNLGLLFLTDEGKLKFFELAYKFASDTERYGVLETELKGEDAVKRFKTLLRN